jgi:hypothetical protein
MAAVQVTIEMVVVAMQVVMQVVEVAALIVTDLLLRVEALDLHLVVQDQLLRRGGPTLIAL